MFWKPKKIPVLVAGMWPAQADDPSSGARVHISEKVGEKPLLDGFSDMSGQFRGQISREWAGKKIRVFVIDEAFKVDDYQSVKVERWGMFLAIRQQKDPAYSGSSGAEAIDPDRYSKWNSSQEHARASEITHSAARRAKLTWPIGFVGLALSFVLGVAGFYYNPIVGLVAGVAGAWGTNSLAEFLLNKGY